MTGARSFGALLTRTFLHRILDDDALRLAFVWLLLIGLNSLTLLGLQLWWARSAGEDVLPARPLMALLWLAAAVYLAVGRQRRRCRRLDLSLPIPGRSLWLSHLIAVSIGALAAVLLSLAPMVALAMPRFGTFGVELSPDLPGGVLHLLAAVLLVTVILQSHRPDLWRIPAGRHWWTLLALTSAGLLVWALTVALTPPWAALGTVLLAVLLGIRTYRSLPGTLSLAPAERTRTGRSRNEPAGGAPSRRWGAERALYSILYRIEPWGSLTTWVVLPLVALFGAVMAGWIEIWVDASELRFLYLPFAVYMQLSAIGPVTQNIHKLDALPVSRRRLFALVVLPALLALLAGYWSGRLDRRQRVTRVTQVEYRVEGEYHWVQPPPGYLEIAWDGAVPELESPWGERHPAWSAELASWSRIRVFSPFNTAETASADFEALLTSRAIAAVHGLAIEPDEIRDRYFVVEGDTVVGLREGGLALTRDHPDLRPAASGPEAAIVLGTALVLYFVVLALFLSTFRASLSDRAKQVVFWGFLSCILLVLFTQAGLAISDRFRPDAARILFEVAVRRLGELPLGTPLVWAGAVLAVCGGYLLAGWRFERAEFSSRPARFTLIDFRRDADATG